MRRRDFVFIAGGAAWVWPRAAIAQRRPKVYRIGFLTTGSGPASRYQALDAALADLGYQEGVNLVIERRYAAGNLDGLPILAAELVRADVELIVTQTTPAALAAKRATAKIPIVMTSGGDPVGTGLVASLARPGGNVTGLSSSDSLIDGKKVEFLSELKPDIRRIAYAGNSQIAAELTGFRDVQKAAAAIEVDAVFVNAPFPDEFESIFLKMQAERVDAVIVPPSARNTDARVRIVEAAARYRLPAAYGRREFVEAGGLISYGWSRRDRFRRVAIYVDKILKGASPADLPVQQATKFELVINRRTASALGLRVPRSLLARADELIE